MPTGEIYSRPHTGHHSRSGSTSSSRRPSLTRSRSSLRLIKTISIDRHKEVALDFSDGELDLSKLNDSLQKLKTEELKDNSISKEMTESKLPILSGLKVAVSSANPKNSSKSEYIEIPYVKATLDSTLPTEYLKRDILNVAHILRIRKWHSKNSLESKLNPDHLTLTKISGAMTNSIFKVEYPKIPSLLLRVYGKNNDSIIDRDYELQILARLSIRSIGPSLYGCFENGRFEQYLENSRTLGRDNIRDWKTSQRIARRMKELHSGVPLLRSEIECGPASWNKLLKWLTILETRGKDWVAIDENIKEAFKCDNWEHFKKIIHQYHDWLYKQERAKPPLVFCHNDAQYGNLLFTAPVVESIDTVNPVESSAASVSSATSNSSLFPTSSGVSVEKIINPTKLEQSQDSKLVVIDFEYAGPNPAAYDLANHLSEWMHDYSGTYPYKCNPDAFPNKEQMLNFLYSYVSHLQGGDKDNRKTVIDNEVRYFYNSIIRWRATVQLFWSIWGILQSGTFEPETEEPLQESIGPNGEIYIIKTEEPADAVQPTATDEEDQDEEDSGGVNVDTFDYIKYCSDKISVFWSDLVGLGIIDESDCTITHFNVLDVNMI
ncbi:similar to Saccharomyces cerevisiae YDR147W EKI1 Ethanolamine kinase [Maudiozyma saulgeensis]|uniref:Similar to Saccharomyces cerevisiae YDR147W EKI1 Ethanolamine kinase n=1 Tax=Maudiozyma saulgeensis TaxID=1789683 RepID=A0A1X7R550_9SACH|nr:similar to Saccharomyces cerevisiae YDR147W EKI1 Ethanolamine kinase [Kazachstania saulgeensis]